MADLPEQRNGPGRNIAIVVLMPVYNDWSSLKQLIVLLNGTLSQHKLAARLIVVDDGSSQGPGRLIDHRLEGVERVDLVVLRRNLGHQKAICTGLAWVEANVSCDCVVVMDSDGEDDARDVPRLIQACRASAFQKIIFAERMRRSEGFVFRVCYVLYRLLHRILTGMTVRVGNFSVIPFPRLRSLVVVPEMWSHYAAAVFSSKQPYGTIPTRRAKRLDGRSKMSFISMVVHGLTAISVFSEIVGVRLFVLATAAILLVVGGMAAVTVTRLYTDLAIAGWATYAFGILATILTQIITVCFLLVFVVLNRRKNLGDLPCNGYQQFIDRVQPAHESRDE